ncbi:ESPR domain-containing protein, partial [Acinetobacter sp. Res13-Abat-PEC13-P2-01]
MNKIYKLIWGTTQNAWVVCSELGKKGKCNSQRVESALKLTAMPIAIGMFCSGVAISTAYAVVTTPILVKNTTYNTNQDVSIINTMQPFAIDAENSQVTLAGLNNTITSDTPNLSTGAIYAKKNSTVTVLGNATFTSKDTLGPIRSEENSSVYLKGASTILKAGNADLIFMAHLMAGQKNSVVEIEHLTEGNSQFGNLIVVGSNGTVNIKDSGTVSAGRNLIESSWGTVNLNNGTLTSFLDSIYLPGIKSSYGQVIQATNTINISNADLTTFGSFINNRTDTNAQSIINLNNSKVISSKSLILNNSQDGSSSATVNFNKSTSQHNGYWTDNMAGTLTVNANASDLSGLTKKANAATSYFNINDATWQLTEVNGDKTAQFTDLNLVDSRLVAYDLNNQANKIHSNFILQGNVAGKNAE